MPHKCGNDTQTWKNAMDNIGIKSIYTFYTFTKDMGCVS